MKIGNFDLDKDGIFIIAELSANHSGSIDIAKKSIKAAKEIGADAIKLQTYRAEDMTFDIDRDEFMANPDSLWAGEKLYDLYKKAVLPLKWHKELFEYAREIDIDIFSSPFSIEMVDFLEQFNPSAYKIASFEITDYELIKYTASKQKPIIISTGVATIDEIKDVVDICKSVGNENIILLKCTSSYPAPPSDANLLMIPDMAKRFNVTVGFSDHTLGINAPIAAVSLGAKVIEKHFILDKSINSADAKFSLDKDEFKAMVDALRQTQQLLGSVDYTLNKRTIQSRKKARTLYVSKDIKKGDIFTKNNIKAIRASGGLHPKYLNTILGQVAKKDYKYGDKLTI